MRTACTAIFAASLFSAIASGQTAPALRLTDGVNTVTIDANNNVTFSSGCSCVTTGSSGTAGNPGQVSWMGTIGGFTVASAQGNAQNSSFANPDLAIIASRTGAGSGTLTVS